MRKWSLDLARPALWIPILLVAGLAAPVAADIYAWRTDDGVFSYTDDPKNIPSRYAEEAVRVPDTRLENYRRLTREDTATARAVAARQQTRLEYLRRINGLDVSAPSAPTHAAAAARTTVSVSTGNPQAPTMDIAVDATSEPVVIEPILSKEDGQVRTRRSTLVKQGDRTLALIKGRSHDQSPTDDIHDEDDLIGRR